MAKGKPGAGNDAPLATDGESRALEGASGAFERLIGVADVSRAFGQPIQRGDTTLIPAAEVLAFGGFGIGSGSAAEPGASGAPRRGGGGGGGGGGRTLSRSVAVVVVSPEGVRIAPVVDVTKIAMAALTAAGFVIAAWSGMARPKRFR